MKFLFFPFTQLRQLDSDLLLPCFERVSFFCVASRQELDRDPDRLTEGFDPITLSAQTLKPVMNAIKGYRNWAELHGGSRGSLKTLLRDTPYFTSDTSVATIRSGIRKGSVTGGAPGVQTGELAAPSPEEAFTQSLVFLRLAQEADLENEAIDLKLSSVDKTTQSLMSEIKGEGGRLPDTDDRIAADDSGRRLAEDPGGIMTQKRVAAWAALFKEKGSLFSREEPLLLVTTSSAVLDYLEASAEKCRKILDIDKFKVHEGNCEYRSQWQAAFMDAVSRAVAGEEAADITRVVSGTTPGDTCPLSAGLKLYFFSGDAIRNMLCCPDGQGVDQELFQGPEFEIPVCLISPK